MRTTLRLFTLLTALLLGAMLFTPALHATAASSRPQGNSPESILLNAANRDRAAIGLPLSQRWPVVTWLSKRPIRLRARFASSKCRKRKRATGIL